jgi:hypothetical protein
LRESKHRLNDPSTFAIGALEGDGWMISPKGIRYFYPKVEQNSLTPLKLAAFLNFFLRPWNVFSQIIPVFVNIFEAVTISHKLGSVFVSFSLQLSSYSFAVQSAAEAE